MIMMYYFYKNTPLAMRGIRNYCVGYEGAVYYNSICVVLALGYCMEKCRKTEFLDQILASDRPS